MERIEDNVKTIPDEFDEQPRKFTPWFWCGFDSATRLSLDIVPPIELSALRILHHTNYFVALYKETIVYNPAKRPFSWEDEFTMYELVLLAESQPWMHLTVVNLSRNRYAHVYF